MTGPKGKDPAGGFNGEIVVDTGNTAGLLVPQGYSTLLENRKPSKMRCTSASGDRMQIGEDGELPIHVTTEGGHVNFDLPLKLDCTTSAELGQLILSIHPFFATGDYDFLWRSKSRGGCQIVSYTKGTNAIDKIIPMRYDHKSKTTYLDFNTRKAPENSPPGVNFLSQKYSPPVVSSPPEVNPTFIENSENSPPEVNFLSQNFSPPEVNRLLYTKNNHLIMETISSQGEDAVIQYLSTVPCVEYLIFCHDEQKLDIYPTVYNIKFGEESAIVSAKRNLKKEKKRQPIALFSATHGHLGCQNSNCPICVRKMGNKVKLQNTPNCSMKERKRGFRWRLDTCTFDQRNFEGEKYAFKKQAFKRKNIEAGV